MKLMYKVIPKTQQIHIKALVSSKIVITNKLNLVNLFKKVFEK